jgi:hypothetical protein
MTHMSKDRIKKPNVALAGLLSVLLGAGLAFAAAPAPAAPAKPAAKKAKKPAPAPAEKKPGEITPQAPKAPPIVGRRDPFKLPGPPAQTAEGGEIPLGNLPPGTRGLVISRLRLEGIVRLDTTNTLIAVVDTNANRAYFLRENDAVYNGVVAKITPDSVTFRENTLDSAGKVGTREVVLRLTQGPGA